MTDQRHLIMTRMSDIPPTDRHGVSEQDLVTTHRGEAYSVPEAARIFDLDPILERHGTWAVTDYGLECLVWPYAIEADRLGEPDWLAHMRGKTWVNMGDFAVALAAAQRRHAPPSSTP